MSGYIAYRLAACISRRLPGRSAYWVGLRVADWFYATRRRDREAVVRNLRQIYTHQGIVPARRHLDGIARKTFQCFGKYIVDFFRYAHLTPEDVREMVSLQHPEYLEETHRLGRGVLAVTAHFGNWEIAGAVLHALGYPVHAVVLPERLQKLNDLLQQQREQRGIHLIPAGDSVRGIIRCLRNGALVGLLADRDFTPRDDRVEFFGKPARMPRGAAALALKTGAPVVPCLLIRQEDDTFLLRFHPPIFPEQERTEQAIRNKINKFLEREIAERPFQWFIFDDYWRDGRDAKDRGLATP